MVEAEHRAVLIRLFELWDTDGSGSVDCAEVEGVMLRYKDGTEADAVSAGERRRARRAGHVTSAESNHQIGRCCSCRRQSMTKFTGLCVDVGMFDLPHALCFSWSVLFISA